MANFLVYLGWGIYGTVAMAAITIKDNREFARDEIQEVNTKIYELQLNRDTASFKYVDPANNNQLLESWRKKEIAKKYEWLSRPFYKQLAAPPITTFVDLHYPLDGE